MKSSLPIAPGLRLNSGDALLLVDVQNDFLPGGALAVPDGDAVIPELNRYIEIFQRKSLPVYATRDWHPPDHCSFVAQGGVWPPHCIAGSRGAEFAAQLELPATAPVISKAASRDANTYSEFTGTDLARRLHAEKVSRLFIGGLATDYCVLNTVLDALARDFKVMLLLDAIRAVNLKPGDGKRAIDEMVGRGARPICFEDIAG